MDRNIPIIGTVFVLLAGVSCEKHQWEDSIVVKQEKVYDSDLNLIGVVENKEVEIKGAKRFFIETHSSKSHADKDHADKDHGDQHTGKPASAGD